MKNFQAGERTASIKITIFAFTEKEKKTK